jgi:glycosyltransferase involved in cell wall biosynthesis
MKIAHVITTVNKGGAENHLKDLVFMQKFLGHDIYVFYLKGNGYWENKFIAAGIKVFNLKLKFYGDIFPIFRLRKFLNNINPDILHAHMPPAELYSYFTFHFLNKKPKFFISKHNDERFYSGPFSKVISKRIASKSGKIIAISNAVYNYFSPIFNCELIEMRTIHYGLNAFDYRLNSPLKLDKLRREFNIDSNVLLFGTVARLVPQKSLDNMLLGFCLYKKISPNLSKIMIVGTGPLERKLKRLCFKLGISNDVIWAGFREDIPCIMNLFDVFILTSKYEGFGLVLLEAMAAAKPIIASSVSAIPEIVINDQTGLLCESDNASNIALMMSKMENSKYRNRLGDAGYSRLTNHFTVDSMAQQTIKFYKDALSEVRKL